MALQELLRPRVKSVPYHDGAAEGVDDGAAIWVGNQPVLDAASKPDHAVQGQEFRHF